MRREVLPAPVGDDVAAGWGSDLAAATLRELDIAFIALTPGSSYRGLHDSLVNLLGNHCPEIVLCLHEEHAVAIAHGYAKVTEAPMAVAVHSNVGLMHASMAIYNAFCDRVPMMVLGATGPVDASKRRPWIDWLHTAADQGALVRPYVKWDDQPGSPEAAVESLVRAYELTVSYPRAPTYVCLDVSDQEARVAAAPPPPRRAIAAPPPPDPALVARSRELLLQARQPLFLMGRVSRSEAAWEQRIRLVEAVGAGVLTDLKVGAAFPTQHPAHVAVPDTFLSPSGLQALRGADVVVALDWVDLGGTLRQAFGEEACPATVITCSMDAILHNGWSKDHFALPPSDVTIPSHPDLLVSALCDGLEGHAPAPMDRRWAGRGERTRSVPVGDGISMRGLAAALGEALEGRACCLVRLPLRWVGDDLSVDHPLEYLGQDGGAGIGSGPGMTVGAAIGLEKIGRIAVSVLGDGDFLMGSSALWTAAHLALPLLVVVANNRSYMNDEVHQERIARVRRRPVENRSVGQRIDDPAPDLAALARSYGLVGHGPVEKESALVELLRRSVEEVANGAAVVIDVHVARREDAMVAE